MDAYGYHGRGKTAILAFFFGLLLLLPVRAEAARADAAPISVERSGRLPSSGRIVLRSGLARLNETHSLFRTLQQSLIPLLREKGLTVTPCPPSALGGGLRDSSPVQAEKASAMLSRETRPPRPVAEEDGGIEDAAQTRAKRLGSEGKLPQVKLNAYTLPSKDEDLPDSVTGIRSPDRLNVLFSLSQERGIPLLNRRGPIPGRIPSEVTTLDPRIADYVMICRFSLVSASSRSQSENSTLFAAAGGVSGISGIGYGKGGGSAPPRRPTYGGTKEDYARGYEGLSPVPGDPWGREADMRARNYMRRYGPEDEFATPPQGAAATGTPGGRYIPATAREIRSLPPGSSGVTGYALELECYSLARIRQGKKPALVWKAVAHQKAHGIGLAAALPGMAAKVISQ